MDDGSTLVLVPHKAESAVKDSEGQTIALTYATKNEVQRALADGSVTKVGVNTVGGANRPIYLLNGVPTVASNVVTTDTEQAITGAKAFSGSDLIRTVDIPNYGISYEIKHSDVELGKAIGTARYWNEILSRDKNNHTLWQIEYDHLTNGDSQICLNMSNDQGNKVALGLKKINNVIYAVAPTPTDSTPSNVIVTKANVMSTDGKLNNLVHTVGDEEKNGRLVLSNASQYGRRLALKNTFADVTTETQSNSIDIDFIDKNDSLVGKLFISSGNRTRALIIRLFRNDGTYQDTELKRLNY